MAEETSPHSSEELYDLLEKLPHRMSGFILDGAGITWDKSNQVWVLQKKERGQLIKMTVPTEFNDVVKSIKELNVDVAKADLKHMEDVRRKMRDTRQPILAEEIDQAGWSVRVPFLLGQALYMKALQHVDLTAEERKSADLAVAKFLAYYEGLIQKDVTKLSLGERARHEEIRRRAEEAARTCGYTVTDRVEIPFMVVKYECAGVPPANGGSWLSRHADEVMIAKCRWNPKTEEETIRSDIYARMSSLY
jgi:hypothetical protein